MLSMPLRVAERCICIVYNFLPSIKGSILPTYNVGIGIGEVRLNRSAMLDLHTALHIADQDNCIVPSSLRDAQTQSHSVDLQNGLDSLPRAFSSHGRTLSQWHNYHKSLC